MKSPFTVSADRSRRRSRLLAILALAALAVFAVSAEPAQAQSRDTSKDIPLRTANGNPAGIWSDGTVMYVLDRTDTYIYTYDLIARSNSARREINLHPHNDSPEGIWSDGVTMWVVDRDDKLFAYNLATGARDTAKEFNYAINDLTFADHQDAHGIWSDGKTVWISNDQENNHFNYIYAYDLATGALLRHDTYTTLTPSSGSAAGNAAPSALWSDGLTMWVADEIHNKVYAYLHSNQARFAVNNLTPLDFNTVASPTGLWSDGTTMWVASAGGDKGWLRAYTLPTRNMPSEHTNINVYNTHEGGRFLRRIGQSQNPHAQGFVTGEWPAGYDLRSVTFTGRDGNTARTTEVRVYELDQTTGLPGTLVAKLSDLAHGDTSADGSHTSTAPRNTHLKPRTTYFVEISCASNGSGDCFLWRPTTQTSESQHMGGIWSILDAKHTRGASGWTQDGDTAPLLMQVQARRGLVQGVWATDLELQAVTVKWNHWGGAHEHVVQWAELAIPQTFLDSNSATVNTLSHKITGLSPGKSYTVKVTPRRGGVSYDAQANFTLGSTLFFTPTVTGAAQALDVSWNAVEGASSYYVLWKSGSELYDTNSRSSGALTSTSYRITGLTPALEHTVRVTATLTPSGVLHSTEATGKPNFGPVTGVTARPSSESGTSLEVSWDAMPGAESYQVFWKGPGQQYDSSRSHSGHMTTEYTISGLTTGTEYTVSVRAVAAGIKVSPDSETTGTPSDFTVTVEALEGALKINWPEVTDAGGLVPYTVRWKSGSQAYSLFERFYNGAVSARSYTISGLTGGVEYTIHVQASDAGGTVIAEAELTGTPTLAKVTGLGVVEVTDTGRRLGLSWNAVSGAASYLVQWKSSGEFTTTNQATVTTPYHTIRNLTTGTEYTVRVRAVHATSAAAAGPWSDEATGTPTLFAVTVEALDAGGALKVTWPAVLDADEGYQVLWKSGSQAYSISRGNNRRIDVASSATTSATIGGLDPGIEYTIRVQGLYEFDGRAAAIVTVEATGTPTLAKVTGLATTAGRGTLGLSWNAVSGAGSYTVQWKSTGGFTTTNQATPGTNSYTIPNLLGGTEYTVRVKADHATRAAAAGPWSEEATGTPEYPLVPNLGVSVASATSLKLDWDTFTGGGTVHRYGVRWKTSGQNYITYAGGWGSNSRSKFTLSTVTETTITGLTTGTAYTVQVEAYDSSASLLAQSEQTITVTDKPGYTVTPTTLTIAEGGSAQVTIALKKRPTSRVRILPTAHGRRFEVSSASEYLTFTASNWSTPQTVTVSAVEDLIAWDSDELVSVRWVVLTAEEGYIKVNFPDPVRVRINDNDTAGVEVDADPGTTGIQLTRTVGEGVPFDYTIRLKSQPAYTVQIFVNTTGDISAYPPSDLPGYDGNLITFNENNWNTPKRVKVSPRGSLLIDAHRQATITHTLPENNGYNEAAYYGGVTVPTMTLTVNDTTRGKVGFTTVPSGLYKIRPGSSRVYFIRPLVVPTQNMTITLAPSQTGFVTIDTDPDTPGNQNTITFRPGDFRTAIVVYGDGTKGYASPKNDSGLGLVRVTGVKDGLVNINISSLVPNGPHYTNTSTVRSGATKGVQVGTGPGFHSDPQLPDLGFLILNPPYFSDLPEDRTATAGSAFNYTVPEATDQDEDAIAYAASLEGGTPLPSWLGFDPESRTFSGTPGFCDAPAALEIMVIAIDDGRVPLSDSATFTLTVEAAADDARAETPDENLPPEFDPVCALTVPENSAGGVNVGAPVTATDPNGDALSYIALDGADGAFFNLDAGTGQITTRDGVDYDYETKSAYQFMVIVMETDTDEGYLSGVSVTVNLTDVDEEAAPANGAPAFPGASATRSVAENSAGGVNVGDPVTATDPDDGDTLTYTLSGTDAAAFAIAAGTGQITTKTGVTYDYEDKSSYSLTVGASDGNGGTDSVAVTVNLTDVNEAPVFGEGEPDETGIMFTTREVAENSPAGTNVGSAIDVTDPDDGDTLSFSLSGTDATSFAIDAATGQITTKTGMTYDYEAKSSYAIVVAVVDSKGKLNAIGVTVSLTDVNEAPVFSEGDTATREVAENSAAGVNVGAAVTATDPDSGNTLTYTLGGTDAASFAIGGSTGQIITKAGVTYDYETKQSFSLTVGVSDGNGGTDSIAVTVNITDVNEAPVFSEGDTATREVAENSSGGVNVGAAVTATDADNDTLTYTLSGTDAASFAIGGSTGQIITKAGVTYDYETKKSYSLTVDVADSDGLTDSIAVTVNLTDVNETPPEPANQDPTFSEGASATRQVAENSAAGTNVGAAVTATDADNDTLTYTLSGTDAASFEIGGSTGQITTKTGVTYDYETKQSYSVTVGVSDDNGGTDSIAVTLNITDVNETPPVVEKPDPPAPTPPTADAGADFNGKRGEVLTLSGSGTANSDGSQTLTYQWRISGASHTELAAASAFLSSADSAQATFTMPRRKNMTDRSALDDGNWIEFELTVTDGDGESSGDVVRMTIRGTTWKPGN